MIRQCSGMGRGPRRPPPPCARRLGRRARTHTPSWFATDKLGGLFWDSGSRASRSAGTVGGSKRHRLAIEVGGHRGAERLTPAAGGCPEDSLARQTRTSLTSGGNGGTPRHSEAMRRGAFRRSLRIRAAPAGGPAYPAEGGKPRFVQSLGTDDCFVLPLGTDCLGRHPPALRSFFRFLRSLLSCPALSSYHCPSPNSSERRTFDEKTIPRVPVSRSQ